MGGEPSSPKRLRSALSSSVEIPEEALMCVLQYVDDSLSRAAVSLTCRRWHRIDSLTRKAVTVAFSYSSSPMRLRRRFPRLESLHLKSKPRAAMFDLIPEDWGGYAKPWIRELSSPLECLKEVSLRRMVVDDDDVGKLVDARGHMLLTLKLDKCSGFSTDALRQVARCCRVLRTLFLQESSIEDNGGEWLHELALNNSVLTTLNFQSADLNVSSVDLVLLARNCSSLVSLKISDHSEIDLTDLKDLFEAATALEEFAGGTFCIEGGAERYKSVVFPPKICSLGLSYMGVNEMPVIYPICSQIKKLDLQFTLLSTEDHCILISKCPNLLVLEVRNVIGDRGLEVVGETCKKLRRLRIERGDDAEIQDEQGRVTQLGLTAIAVGCRELEYIAAYVSDITNGALESIGTFWTNLNDFRMVLLDREEMVTDLPLDNGVRALLRGCKKLRRFSFYVRPGALTDVGLHYIGQFSGSIHYMLLGNVGETDDGLINFARECKNLQKLELRGSSFSERALAYAALQMPSLRYMWVQGFKASQTGRDLMIMARPCWNIEFVPPMQENAGAGNADEQPVDNQAQILAFYSLDGKRSDHPESVLSLYPE